MIDKNNEFHRLLVSRIENYSYKINKIIFSRFISTKADPGTFTFWKMDFKHVPYDQNIVKKREDRHRIRRDISSKFFRIRTL